MADLLVSHVARDERRMRHHNECLTNTCTPAVWGHCWRTVGAEIVADSRLAVDRHGVLSLGRRAQGVASLGRGDNRVFQSGVPCLGW